MRGRSIKDTVVEEERLFSEFESTESFADLLHFYNVKREKDCCEGCEENE